MKKNRLQSILLVCLFMASVSAYVYMNQNNNANLPNLEQQAFSEADSLQTPSYQLMDVEILKNIIEQGKNQLPIIQTTNSDVLE